MTRSNTVKILRRSGSAGNSE